MAARKPARAVTVAIAVEAGDWPARRKLQALAEKVIDAALAAKLRTVAGSEISLLFTDDAHMKKLNGAWRKKRKATNVLSFPGSSPGKAGFGPFLGDIVLAFETIGRESQAGHLTFEDHLTHLILHGTLHLFGFDHAKNNEAVRMEGLETAILGGLGIKDPYRAPGD